MKSFIKQPSENKDYLYDWTDWLPEGDSISSAAVVAESGITLGAKTLTASTVRQFISGGTHRRSYKVTCTITTAQGRIDEREITIRVIET